MEDFSILLFMHSLLRWAVLVTVASAAAVAWRSLIRKTPILVWERLLVILAMVLCHVQLLAGVLLYAINYKAITQAYNGQPDLLRYWKFEHAGMMVLAILVVTIGRILSKRARAEGAKQMHIAIFYTIGLLMMLWYVPWPFTFVGSGRGWL